MAEIRDHVVLQTLDTLPRVTLECADTSSELLKPARASEAHVATVSVCQKQVDTIVQTVMSELCSEDVSIVTKAKKGTH